MNNNLYYKYRIGNKYFLYSGKSGLIFLLDDNNIKLEHYLEYDDEVVQAREVNEITPNIANKPFIRNVMIFMTYSCNLACTYCYEKGLANSSNDHMNLDKFKEVFYNIMNNFEYGKTISFHFFGGEPLLYFKEIKEIVGFLESTSNMQVRYSFSLTTNGTILNKDILSFLNDYDFGINISIDGEKEIHDSKRQYKASQKGTFNDVLKNAELLIKMVSVDARVTISDEGLKLKETALNLRNAGFEKIYFDLVSGRLNNAIDKRKLSRNIKKLAHLYLKELKNKNILNISNFSKTLKNIHFGLRKTHYCQAGISSYSVAPDGKIFLCHRFMENDSFLLGSTEQGWDFQKQANLTQNGSLVNRNNNLCSKCWAGTLCGGSCYYPSFIQSHDISAVDELHCYFEKEIIKSSLFIYSEMNEDERQYLENFKYRI